MKIKKTRCMVHGEKITIEEVEAPRTFENQIILYAKHWYKRTENGVLADLKVLLSEYIGQDASLQDVKQILCSCFAKYCPEYARAEAIQDMLGWSWLGNYANRTPAEIMLGKLSICKGKYVDTDELLPVLGYSEDEKTPLRKERDSYAKNMESILS